MSESLRRLAGREAGEAHVLLQAADESGDMVATLMDECCDTLVEALLGAIEARDLHAMELHVEALRDALSPLPAASSLQAEQVDALRGLAEEIERSLRRMRTSAAGEMARIRSVAPLLEHVALGGRPPLAQQ
jgi:hypothetical protein